MNYFDKRLNKKAQPNWEIIAIVIIISIVMFSIIFFNNFFSYISDLFGQRPSDIELVLQSCKLKASSGIVTVEEYCGDFKYVEFPSLDGKKSEKGYVGCGYSGFKKLIQDDVPDAPICISNSFETSFCDSFLKKQNKQTRIRINDFYCDLNTGELLN